MRTVSGFELALVVLLALALFVPGIWSYTLVDPWETHYAEVARRMLQDEDWVHTQWQNEGFRSKPVLTFWLMAASMKALGVGDGGGFSGEMTASPLVMFAVRLPFVLFGVLGLVMTWWMLARLASRRVAWLAFLVLGTSPFYFLVARQAITDILMVSCLIGSMACFALALHSGDEPLRPLWRRVTAFHLFGVAISLIVGWQILYYAYYFTKDPSLAYGIRFPMPQVTLPGAMLVGLVGFLVWAIKIEPTRYSRQVYMYWFYTFVAISVLAKGLPALGIAGAICFFYILITNSWRLVAKVELPRGILLCLLIAAPWHLAMWLKDGRPFIRDYFIDHNWNRLFKGVHGDRGTFDYMVSQLGIGMWPWVGFLPAAVAGVLSQVSGRTRTCQLRLIIGIWAVAAVFLFASGQTKFHHYIFPAVPALAMLLAFWLDDLLAGRIPRIGIIAAVAATIILLLTRDLMGEQKQLIELFVYRYDRPWPDGEPWNVDLSDPLLGFGLAFAALALLLAVRRARTWVFIGLAAAAVVFSYWGMNVYMSYAGMHWGQRTAVQTYYQERQIYGIDIQYYGARQLADEWADFSGEYMIETVVPEHLSPGQPMAISIQMVVGTSPQSPLVLQGEVSRISEHRFWVAIEPRELAKLRPLIESGRTAPGPRRRPWKQVNADRLIAWQLYWRGENFWSGDEIWGRSPETQTAFKNTDNKEFLNYLNSTGQKGRRYYVITESGRATNLRSVLPTQMAKDTYEIIDRSSNKFTLISFTL